MIRSTVKAFPHVGSIEAKVQQRTIEALTAAATQGAAVANQQATGITTFTAYPPVRTADGYASWIRGRNPIWRVFDKGSLGKRTAKLKRNRRKDSWQVNRKGTTYTAHRRSTESGGVAPRNISNPARTAGRRALIAAIRGR